jgi:hypothetical protein
MPVAMHCIAMLFNYRKQKSNIINVKAGRALWNTG